MLSEMAQCTACRSLDTHPVALSFCDNGIVYRIKRCVACASLFYDPAPAVDYRVHTEAFDNIRDYVEQNANLPALVTLAVANIGNRRGGRLLDMGCGFGFSADAARRLKGWDVIGVEPSTYGRIGAEALGIRIVNDFIDEHHPLSRDKFDIIIASEVVEHIEDPIKFLALLRGMLLPGGRLVLTVPGAEAATSPETSEASRLAVLTPGAHITLFSPLGLELALRAAGFREIQIEPRGVSLMARAAEQPITAVEPVNETDEQIAYFNAVLAVDQIPQFVRHGVGSCLFRLLINLGRYDEAAKVEPHLPGRQIDFGKAIKTLPQFMAAFSAALPTNLFYHGIMALNWYSDPDYAVVCFKQSFELCALKIRLAPSLSVVETDLLWQASYHVAYASLVANRRGDALWEVARIDFDLPKDLPPPREHQLQLFRSLRARIMSEAA